MGVDQHTDLLPRLSCLAAGERELTADEGEAQHRLRIQSAVLLERAAPAAKESLGERAITGPQHRLHFEASQRRAEADRRVELEGAIEHLVGPTRLTEGVERTDHVREQHRARGAFHSALPRALRAFFCGAHGLFVAAEQVQGVRLVDPVPKPRRIVADGELPGEREIGEAGLDVAAGQP